MMRETEVLTPSSTQGKLERLLSLSVDFWIAPRGSLCYYQA